MTGRKRFHRTAAPGDAVAPAGESGPTDPAATSPGTVIFLFGRYVAGAVEMLTYPGFKTLAPLNGVSPFTAAGEADPELEQLADAERSNDRVRADLRKDLAARLAGSGADYLVVDNTAALLWHREVNSRRYVALPTEQTELADLLWSDDDRKAPKVAYRVGRTGLTDELRRAYDEFADACTTAFDPNRIILVRAHAARFRVTPEGRVEPTDVNRADARLLHELDDYFAARTGCRVSNAALGCFPEGKQWHSGGHAMRSAIERDLVTLCSPNADDADDRARSFGPADAKTAADHVLGAARGNGEVKPKWLATYFGGGNVSYDDLLALAYLHQQDPAAHDNLIGKCIRSALSDGDSFPVATTRRLYDRSVRALKEWKPYRPRLPLRTSFRRQVSLRTGQHVFRFRDGAGIEQHELSRLEVGPRTDAVVEGADLDLTEVVDAVGSWPLYFARGRQGVTSAPTVSVPDAASLVDSCYWIDWAWVLRNERIVVHTAGSQPADLPRSKTDLSFVFDPAVRVCTVGGGLMDQVTHIAMFDEICSSIGVDYYLDDFRYTWWRSHNGFEASRLAPQLEAKRMTNQVSHALIDSFRREVLSTRLPWVFNQSRFWHENGLPEALVVTREYFNAQRLMEIGPTFPVLVYPSHHDLAGLMKDPPAPVCFFTTQQRIKIAGVSAPAIRRVFSYRHLEEAGLPAEVAQTASTLRATRHVALHVRRGDYLNSHFDTDGWFSRQDHYIAAIDHVIENELGTSDFDVAVFSDDLEFVDAHRADYGLDRITGDVHFVRGNAHYRSIFDSYLMSLCPVIVGSVGFFAATTSLLADPSSLFIRARPEGVRIDWRGETGS